jgi:predicted ABC-type ATPase
MSEPICWIIAGPNGAGKTTFALNYLPQVALCRNFVNADLIAAGLSPLAPSRELVTASRLFLQEMNAYIEERSSFGFETTLAGRGYLKRVEHLVAEGWEVNLIYLALPNVELSVQRVAERVAHGGHDVPEPIIRRRFPRSLWNLLEGYAGVVTSVRCFMNGSDQPEPVFIEERGQRSILDPVAFELLKNEARP